MTPGEAVAVVRARAAAAEREIDLALIGAWYAERFARAKRLPSLRSLLARPAAQPTEAEKERLRADHDVMMEHMAADLVLR